MAYGMQVVIAQPYTAVVEQVQAALAAEGLAVLTTHDVADTFRQSFALEIPAQLALGIGTELLARAALQADASVGLLLPCSIVVRAAASDVTVVEAPKLSMIVAITGDRALEPAVAEADARLRAAFARLQDAGG